MAKSKLQKQKAVKEGLENFKSSETIILADFTGLSVNEMNILRRSLRVAGVIFKVLKKRLLKIIFEKESIVFDPKKFSGQTGVVFSNKDLVETSGLVYKFAKNKDLFKILGGFDIKEKKFIESEDVKHYGLLPSREILLSQLAYMFGVPIRKLMFVLDQKSKKMVERI